MFVSYRMIFRLSILLTTVFAFLVVNSTAQVQYYDILKGKEKLGEIKAEKKVTNTTTTFTVVSKAVFSVIFEYVRETDMTIKYVNDEFFYSDSKQIMDGKIKEHHVTQKQTDGYYLCTQPADEDERFVLKSKINFTTSMMYFKEPVGQTHIFAESFHTLCPLKLISPGIYEMTLPGDKINHYVYKNGVLQEVRVFRSIVDLVFRRAS